MKAQECDYGIKTGDRVVFLSYLDLCVADPTQEIDNLSRYEVLRVFRLTGGEISLKGERDPYLKNGTVVCEMKKETNRSRTEMGQDPTADEKLIGATDKLIVPLYQVGKIEEVKDYVACERKNRLRAPVLALG